MPAFFPASEQPAGSTRQLLREPDGSVVRRTVLPTGLRVVSESVPGAHSVTLGIWAQVGSRDETPTSAGAAHFLEHLLFKGTPTRTALDIAAEIDAVGGQMNAFTSKEYTCFYAKVLGNDLPVAVDVMMDITTRASLRAEDIDAERTVVLEEIAMHDDDPADRAGEALDASVLAGSRLALPILGTRESITGMSPRVIRSCFRRHYVAPTLAVTAAGNVDHAHLVQLVRTATADLDWAWGVGPADLPTRKGRRGAVTGEVLELPWPGEQCTVSLATRGLPRSHADRRALDVLNTIVGGGMSSRLFQAVREERGLAYSVYSGHAAYSDAGVWSVSAGCQPARAAEVFEVIGEELDRVVTDGVTDEEITRAKGHLSGSIVLAGEDTSSRMVTLGRAEVATGELVGLGEALDRIDRVTPDDVARVSQTVLAGPRTVCAVGAPKTTATRRALAAATRGGAA
ncbi:MAG: pitrilysin family protein [Candidatus Nanopelagicales bacterium]